MKLAHEEINNSDEDENEPDENATDENANPNPNVLVPTVTPCKRVRSGHHLPHFSPARAAGPLDIPVITPLTKHKLVKISEVKRYSRNRKCLGTMSKGYCKACLPRATWKTVEGNAWPTPHLKSNGEKLKRVSTVCMVCREHLCSRCFVDGTWDHRQGQVVS